MKADETRGKFKIKHNCDNLFADFCKLAIRFHTHRVRDRAAQLPRSCWGVWNPLLLLAGQDRLHAPFKCVLQN